MLAVRALFLHVLSLFTFSFRLKGWNKQDVKNVLIFAQKRMGDTVASIPTLRAIRWSLPQSRIFICIPPYIKDIVERIENLDEIIEIDSGESLLKRAKKIRQYSDSRYDLAIDLTCDYTLEAALLSFLSRAKFRVGYDTFGRGFLFNRSIPHRNRSVHMIEELLGIVKSINIGTDDKTLKITASAPALKKVSQFLLDQKIREGDWLVGIHPGGFYPTQRWFPERFAQLADEVIRRLQVKVVLLGGPREKKTIEFISENMENQAVIFAQHSIAELMALIQSCRLLICNNSGPLHLATALGTPTVSIMGPTLPTRWWPHGEGHVVLRKDLSCMPCNEGICEQKTIECLALITMEEVMEAVESQLSKSV